MGYANEILVINQWDNIGNITCERNNTRCLENGEGVISFFNMKEVELKKKS